MSILEQVLELKKGGVSDKDIIIEMQQRGIPPKEIDSALQQASIKDAVMQSSGDFSPNQAPQQYEDNSNALMESFQDPNQTKDIGGEQYYSSQNYGEASAPQAEEPYAPQQADQGYYQPQTQDYGAPAPGPSQEFANYDDQQQEVYEPSLGLDSETITEIAEQVVLDKTKEMRAQLENTNEFKSIAKAKIDHIEDRLHRIEQMIDKLQLSILDKVGSYVGGVEHIKKEMAMMQDSFGKVLENENLEKLKHIASQRSPSSPPTPQPKTKTVHIVHHKSKSLGLESKSKPTKKKRL